MTDFLLAFVKTMGHEGGYSNDPNDPGGETYRGISRRYHSAWSGWDLIDSLRRNDIPLDESGALAGYVQEFYQDEFWSPLRCGKFPQPIANELFDTAVNQGLNPAATFFQRSLNVLNRQEKLYENLVVDGLIGGKTQLAFEELDKYDQRLCLTMMNVLQGAYYMDRMRESEVKEKYARGWFKRVVF